MKTIYVDDNKLNRMQFEQEIEGLELITSNITFAGAKPAYDFITKHKNEVDLAFLDIEMPGKNGIWLAEKLSELNVPFVFLSAHNHFAHQAFNVKAIHYLLKPITRSDIEASLHRLQLILSGKNGNLTIDQLKTDVENFSGSPKAPQRIFIHNLYKSSVVDLNDVICFSASRSYTEIYTNDGGKLTSTKTLGFFEDTLGKHPDFIRIHRGSIVNKKYVRAIVRDKHKIYSLMQGDLKFEVSPALRDQIFDILS